MKKIYSLFMALSIVLCAMANSPYIVENQWSISTSEVAETLHSADVATHKVAKQAKFNQQDREAIAAKRIAKATPALQVNGARQINAVQAVAKQAMPANAVRKAPAKATEGIVATDTVVILGGDWSYEYYAESGDWYMAVIDETQTYVVRLDYLAEESGFAGTFGIDDLDLGYSYLTIYDTDGTKTFVDYVEAEFTVTVTEDSKFLEANLLCEDSIRYLVSAAELPLPEAKDTVELAYTSGHLEDGTRSSETFQFWADENGVYTSLLIASEQVEGEYTEKDMYADYANYILFVDGTDSTFVDFLGLNLTVTKENQTYFADAYALGVDTMMYHITMSYTKPAPTDTIEIVATNMTIDEFEYWGMYFCTITASNEEYKVTLDMKNGLPLGELTSADFNVEWSSVYRIADDEEIAFEDILSATVTEVDGQRAITAQALGVDNIIYNMDLSYVLPTATDTVEVVFTTPASAEYFDSEGDYYIYNENEEYIVTLDIYAEKNALEGEYEGEDFYLYYTKVGLIVDGDTTAVSAAAAKATVTKVSDDLVHIDAELLGENGVLYLVSTDVTMSKLGLQYDATEGAVDRTYTAEEVIINKATGYFQIQATAADKSDKVALLLFGSEDDETIIPVGTYEINDTQAAGTALASKGVEGNSVTLSFYGKTNAQGQIMVPCYFFVGGTVEVSAADSKLTIEVNAVNSYDVPVHAVIEYDLNAKQGLQYDAPSGAVDRTYTTEEITFTEKTGYFQVVASSATASDRVAMVLFGNKDEETIIPVGTYEINGTQAAGTVLASTGVSGNSVTLSFYGKTNAQGQIMVPCYFFVGGTVEVSAADGVLTIEVNAVNSYDVPVHIVMTYNLDTKQGLEYDEQTGSVDRTYTSKDYIEIDTEWVMLSNLFVDIVAEDYSDQLSLQFFVSEADEEIGIPVGIYPITSDNKMNTILAGQGVSESGSVAPSFYSTLVEQEGKLYIDKLYFLVSGQAVVEKINGKLKMTIDAVNSYDVPVHIVYDGTEVEAGVENVTVENSASKVVENNQLFIMKEGVKYNVLGSVVK